MKHIGVGPTNILGFGCSLDPDVDQVFLAPRPGIGADTDVPDMRHLAYHFALAIGALNDNDIDAAVEHVLTPVAKMAVRLLPAYRIEPRCKDE